MDTGNNNVLISASIVAITSAILSKTAFEKGAFQCKNYVFNTYMYLALTVAILGLTVSTLDKYPNVIFTNSPLLVFLLSLGCLYGALVTPIDKIMQKHLFWLGFIGLVGCILYPQIKSMIQRGTFNNALRTTVVIALAVSAYIYFNPNSNLTNGWGQYLMWGLFSLIIYQIILIVFGRVTTQRVNAMSMVAIVLFTLFLIWDTENIYKRAKLCQENITSLVRPDYITESINISLDLLNIFVNSNRF